MKTQTKIKTSSAAGYVSVGVFNGGLSTYEIPKSHELAHLFILIDLITTVNLEIFVRILFSRIALKDIFATLNIRNWSMIFLYQ